MSGAVYFSIIAVLTIIAAYKVGYWKGRTDELLDYKREKLALMRRINELTRNHNHNPR